MALTINFPLFSKHLEVLQHHLLHKSQVNSLRMKKKIIKTLVDAPHKAVERREWLTIHRDK